MLLRCLPTHTCTLPRNFKGCAFQKKALAWSIFLEAWDYVNSRPVRDVNCAMTECVSGCMGNVQQYDDTI